MAPDDRQPEPDDVQASKRPQADGSGPDDEVSLDPAEPTPAKQRSTPPPLPPQAAPTAETPAAETPVAADDAEPVPREAPAAIPRGETPSKEPVSEEPPPMEAPSKEPTPSEPPPKEPAPVARPARQAVELESPRVRRRWISRGFVRSVCGFLFSTAVHLAVFVSLALLMLPEEVKFVWSPLELRAPSEPPEELETVFLDEQNRPAREMSFAVASGDPNSQAEALAIGEVALDESLTETPTDGVRVDIDGVLANLAGSRELLEEVPAGTPGQARQVVDGYQEAIDRITREIMLMLYKSKVIVIWCFDQSESMKDDQKEIRDRIERVYTELGLSDKAGGDNLVTAITSFGEGFVVHTPKPTSKLEEIRAAIDSVPIDPSGKEVMCQAVGRSIASFRQYASKGQRRMALILVTDESGERDDNVRFLEATIAEANAARCKIYALGREAVFGYPYCYFRWRHPQTGRPHWLRVDRGPETAFVEQLQTNGFRRRYDAFPSGFGPYEESRLARETGGIFFLLPSTESTLVRGDKRRYELEAMQWFQPDLRSREEIFADREKNKLQTLIFSVVTKFNPYDKNAASVIELRVHFSPNPQEFVQQVAQEKAKAKIYLTHLDAAEKEVEKNRFLRDRETASRWKANYDLLFAQLLAYKVRVYEYGAYLDAFVKTPKVVPMKKPPNLSLVHWDITTRKPTLTGDVTKEYIERATELFKQIVKDYPGTPYAARAQWEIGRGFGVDLIPDYEPPYKQVTNPMPLPKL